MDSQILGRLETKIDSVLERLDRVEKYLFIGNGKPSLMSRVEIIENDSKELPLKGLSKSIIFGWIGLVSTVLLGLALIHSDFILSLIK